MKTAEEIKLKIQELDEKHDWLQENKPNDIIWKKAITDKISALTWVISKRSSL